MQDLVLQYLKKTVLRPRAVGRSKFLGGQVIVPFLSKEMFCFYSWHFIWDWGVDCPYPPIPTALLLSNPTPFGMAGFIHKSVFLDLTVC